MPIEIGYTGDLITPSSGMVQPIPNRKVRVIPPVSPFKIDTGQTIYLPYRSICTLHPSPDIFFARGLMVMGNVYQGPARGEEEEKKHRIMVVGFNPFELQVNIVPGDLLCYLVFGQTVPMRLTRRGK